MAKDSNLLLKTVLDSSNIGKSDIEKIQNVVDKYPILLRADLNKDELLQNIKEIVPELETELKKVTGIEIKINDSAIQNNINQIVSDTQQLQANIAGTVSQLLPAFNLIMNGLHKTGASISELQNVNSYLVGLSRTAALTRGEFENLGTTLSESSDKRFDIDTLVDTQNLGRLKESLTFIVYCNEYALHA